MKLVSITFKTAPNIPGLRAGAPCTLVCDNPFEPMTGWIATVRSGSLILTSPRGWKQGGDYRRKPIVTDVNCVMHQVPLQDCNLQWLGTPSEIDEIGKKPFVSSPFEKPTGVVEVTDESPPSLLSQAGLV